MKFLAHYRLLALRLSWFAGKLIDITGTFVASSMVIFIMFFIAVVTVGFLIALIVTPIIALFRYIL